MPLHSHERGSSHAGGLEYLARDFIRPATRPPPQTGKMTLEKLAALIKAGYGQGHFHRYKPWLRVTKRVYSPVSVVGHLPVPDQQRLEHFRSLAERQFILVSKWLGAKDVRAQYPFWPWPHDHPMVGLPGVGTMPRLRGLAAIARDARIKLGTYPGTNLPYVATMDVLSTWHTVHRSFVLVAFDCKPEGIRQAPPGARVRERVELHRRYCIEAEIKHNLVHAEKLPRHLLTNLDALYSLLGPGELDNLRQSSDYRRIVDSMHERAYDNAAFAILQRSAAKAGVTPARAQVIMNAALWTQDLDHDLTEPLELWCPLQRGGRAMKHFLLRNWTPDGVISD